MSLRVLRSTGLAAVALCATSMALAAGPRPTQLLQGFLDPKTGLFSMPAATPSESDFEALATSTYTGTFSFRFTVTLKSGVPSDYPIQCSASVSPIDSSGLYYSDVKTVLASRTGSTATCNLSIYYSWVLANSSALVTTTYWVATSGASSLVSREAIGSLPKVTLPANGGSLSRSVAVTL